VRVVPELLARFREHRPHVTFRLSQDSAAKILDVLERGDADLCLTSPLADRPLLVWHELYREEIALASPAAHGHPMRVALTALRDETFVGMRTENACVRTDELCRAAGFVPKIGFEGEDAATVRGLVAAGLGVALLPISALEGQTRGIAISTVDPRAERAVGIAWVADRYATTAARAFREHVMAAFGAG